MTRSPSLSFLDDDDLADATLADLELHGVRAEIAIHADGVPALHLVGSGMSAYDQRLAILPYAAFGDGSIDATLSGDTLPDAAPDARGFVGVAFHVGAPGEPFEVMWLRPTNGRADDQLRRNHAVQYAAYPNHWWDRLRRESPGVYESYVDLVPGALTAVRIAIAGERARLYVGQYEQPVLLVNDLKLGSRTGRAAIWIGDGTDAWVSRARVRRS